MRRLPALLMLAVTLGACTSAPPRVPNRLVVFAAASLKQSFTQLGDAFTTAHPGVAVDFTFAGSADLLAQMNGGAPADVFASADSATMDRAVADGVVAESAAFATNALTIAVVPGNPTGIENFADLTRVSVVACAPQVPCGAALARIEADTGVELTPVSEETSVTDVLGKVLTGQADAGLVYETDARAAAGRVDAVRFPQAAGAVNSYRIALTRDAADRDAARRFIGLVTGPPGRDVLARAGFGLP